MVQSGIVKSIGEHVLDLLMLMEVVGKMGVEVPVNSIL
jgi:hypothetical protein